MEGTCCGLPLLGNHLDLGSVGDELEASSAIVGYILDLFPHNDGVMMREILDFIVEEPIV